MALGNKTGFPRQVAPFRFPVTVMPVVHEEQKVDALRIGRLGWRCDQRQSSHCERSIMSD